jgi:sec-independent protein translocase protein TatA
MFGFSGEHLLVLLVILLIFGPKRLPDLGHSLGRTLKNFKDAMSGSHVDNQAVPPSAQIPSSPASTPSRENVTQGEKVEPK